MSKHLKLKIGSALQARIDNDICMIGWRDYTGITVC
jgi:hypothetical protein